MNKAKYVLSQSQNRDHTCHWPGCPKQVPPALWGCASHWYTLPKELRDRVWAEYVPGQEISMTPSEAYLEVAMEVERWIKQHVALRDERKQQELKL